MLADKLTSSTCPACGHHVGVAFFNGGEQPLATIAWPASAAEARGMARLPLPFVRCVDCGHIYNPTFDYKQVPYSEKPNRMYNRAPIWGEHLRKVRDLILARLPQKPTVVEIGCGEGHLLRALAEARPDGRYVGFDPNGSVDTADGKVQAHKLLFDPARHLEDLQPDMVISRHVLEHLINPLGFLQRLSFAAAWLKLETLLFIEVPCIDRVFATGRVADFYYEHNSHFTTASFTRMLQSSAAALDAVEHGYDGEVIYGVVRLGPRPDRVGIAGEALAFDQRAHESQATIAAQLAGLHAAGGPVVIWGGTGKGAAFINYYGADAVRFPIVVDSDADKVGTFVPGMGQRIASRDTLLGKSIGTIIIPTQWRAADIVAEIARCGIRAEQVLIEHGGRLVDYHAEPHPYRRR